MSNCPHPAPSRVGGGSNKDGYDTQTSASCGAVHSPSPVDTRSFTNSAPIKGTNTYQYFDDLNDGRLIKQSHEVAISGKC